jgi:hypothetical protein
MNTDTLHHTNNPPADRLNAALNELWQSPTLTELQLWGLSFFQGIFCDPPILQKKPPCWPSLEVLVVEAGSVSPHIKY